MSADLPSHSIDKLYSEHHGWLSNWLRRRLGCPDNAADFAHDTFLRVLNSRRTVFSGEPRAFLTHIAKGLLVDHWRRQAVEQAYRDAIVHLPEAETPSPEERWLIIESLLLIEQMLASLPARTRDMFLLAQLDGLTLEQISIRTGTPVITVRRHIRKALIACMTAV